MKSFEPNQNEESIGRLVRDYLNDELDHSSVKEQKKQFLSTHFFSELDLPWFQFLPAGVLVGFFCVLFFFQTMAFDHLSENASQELTEYLSATHQPTPSTEDFPLIRIQVRRVSSQVGPTIVYQKTLDNHSVTVIWVLTGGK